MSEDPQGQQSTALHAIAYQQLLDAEEHLLNRLAYDKSAGAALEPGLRRIHGGFAVLLGVIDGSSALLDEYDRDGKIRAVFGMQGQINRHIHDLQLTVPANLPVLMYCLQAVNITARICRVAVDKILTTRHLESVQ